MCGNVNIFIAGIEDAERYENKATMHKVDLKELIAKLKKLHGANINAIYERINDYWENYEKIDIEKWADFNRKGRVFPLPFSLSHHHHEVLSHSDVFLVLLRIVHIIYHPGDGHVSLFLSDFRIVSDNSL